MKILIACEFSGIVRDAFTALGHDATSCDLLPTEKPGKHYQGDVRDILNDGWDMMIAHPPCTFLSTAGMANKARDDSREEKTALAMEFVLQLWNAPIEKVCIENPKGVLSTRWKKPTQIIEPYYFGDPNRKMTCLWLRGLRRLNGLVSVAENPKKFIPKPYKYYPNGRPQYWEGVTGDAAPRHLRGHAKSRTFQVFADAMAEQWGRNEIIKSQQKLAFV